MLLLLRTGRRRDCRSRVPDLVEYGMFLRSAADADGIGGRQQAAQQAEGGKAGGFRVLLQGIPDDMVAQDAEAALGLDLVFVAARLRIGEQLHAGVVETDPASATAAHTLAFCGKASAASRALPSKIIVALSMPSRSKDDSARVPRQASTGLRPV